MPWHEAPHRPWWEDYIHPTRDFPARAALQDLRRDGWTVEDIQADDTPVGEARYVFTLVHGATRIPCGPALARGCDIKGDGQPSPPFTAWADFPDAIRTLAALRTRPPLKVP